MGSALMIMIVQGVLGAFDTLYFHEYIYRLPVNGAKVGGELRLHAFRDFVYGLLFLTLPFLTWQGILAGLLALLIVLEVCITIWDFNIEVIERVDVGGIANEERGLHLIMAVVYGFFLAHLLPELLMWATLPSGFGHQTSIPGATQITCVLFGCGVLLSGIRDLGAAYGIGFFRRDLFGRSA